ncbi:MAG: hypothetical protein KA248_13560 [Kiritimatiellae bacterium]|nr:hypothetical protein [Kiritimatiellia bacterium]
MRGRPVWIMGVLLCGAGLAGGAEPIYTAAPAIQYFEWKEDAFRLEEKGLMPCFILEREAAGGERWGGCGSLLAFLGEVEYDGLKQDFTPYRSKTLYVGGDLRGTLHARWNLAGAVELQPLAGFGTRIWKRRLDNTDEMTSGYDEDWINLYLVAGARALWPVGPDGTLALEAGLRHSVYTYERVHFEIIGRSSVPSLEPADQASAYAALTWTRKDYLLKAFYEGLRFGESDVDRSGFYQPESEATSLGVGFGIRW